MANGSLSSNVSHISLLQSSLNIQLYEKGLDLFDDNPTTSVNLQT